VGNAVEAAFAPIVARLNQIEGLTVRLAAVSSDYWGQDISVTGLLTGQDLAHTLSDWDLGERLLLPTVMLKQDDARTQAETYFLDDVSVAALSQQLGCPIQLVEGITGLIAACVND